MRALATEWRELLAGSEGFLTGGRRGLDGREIVWGEMDTFVRFSLRFLFFCSQQWDKPTLVLNLLCVS
jgi:hypothetical protein